MTSKRGYQQRNITVLLINWYVIYERSLINYLRDVVLTAEMFDKVACEMFDKVA
jgi:hypothetical protein